MARMIPDSPPAEGPGRKAERVLYEALASGLPEEFFVYHGLAYLEKGRAAEGEVDFLVLHRELGLLAIECKGRGVQRTDTGKWVRFDQDGQAHALKEDPVQQVQRAVKDLVRELDKRLRQAFPRFSGAFPFVHGYAVAFPLSVASDLQLPLNLQREVLFDASDLTRIGERTLEAFAFWRRASPARSPLSPREFESFRKVVLNPAFHVTESLGAQLLLDADRIVRLTDEQVRALKGILSLPRLSVSGGAGTGKTVLALEAARALALQGRRVLLLCYNQSLARFLDQTVRAWGLEDEAIEVATFHSLCRRSQELLGKPFSPPPREDLEGSKKFWDEMTPFMLLEGLASGHVGPWDGIVVDEGQDFHEDWWSVVDECLRDKDKGALFIFYDPRQEIFGRRCRIPQVGPEVPLRVNVRNTGAVFDAMREFGPLEMDLHPRAPRGREVKRAIEKNAQKAQRMIEREIRAYLEFEKVRPEQIAVLTPHTREHSVLAGLERIADVPLASDPIGRQGAILHATVGRFKGLEADIVFFADVDPQDPLCTPSARYVAVSRARQVLHELWKRPP